MDSCLAILTTARRRHCLVGAVLAGIAVGSASIGFTALAPIGSALAQEQKGGGNTARPEVGKPIQAALDLLKSKRGRDALARVQEADAVPNKTPYEAYLVERVRGQAAAAAGDAATAARAFEASAASSVVSGSEKLQLLASAADQYSRAKNYGKAAELGARYFKDGGTDKSIRTTYVQALYLGNDFARAAREILADVQAEEAAGRVPTEMQLQLLFDSCQKQKDQRGSASALEKLLAYYPKRDYWLNAVYGVAGRAGVSDRLALDLARLKLATGTMQTTNEYMEAAQLSLQAGYPAEAKKFIDQGYAAGLLGTGAESDRHRRLKDMAAKSLAEDAKTLGQDDAQLAAAKDGTALFNAGFNYVLNGKSEKGLEMMEQGMRRGGLKRPDDARLHLGYAYHVAGQKQKAIQVFKTVQGGDGPASLARLWIIHLGRGS
jgi:hypothetical protein